MQSTEANKSSSKLSPFIVSKALKVAARDLKIIRRLKKGVILLEVSSAGQNQCISKLNNRAGCLIMVTPHRTLNISKALKATAGNLKTVRRLQKGDILVEVSSAIQSRCIIKLNNMEGV